MVGIPLREITNINYLQSKHILFFSYMDKQNKSVNFDTYIS